MKYLTIIFFIILIGSLIFYISNLESGKSSNPSFEKQIVRALNLSFVNSDTLYKNTTLLRVFNDTLVGYKSNENPDSAFYFIQSLKNLKYKLQIRNRKLFVGCDNCNVCTDCVTEIQLFKNGCLYFPVFGGSTMFKLCSDGTLTNYFSNQGAKLFYANRILFYVDKTIITSYNGVFVFDTDSQKLLWSDKYQLNNGISEVIGNKLVFTHNDESDTVAHHIKTVIQCLNLDNLKILWKNVMNTGPVIATEGLGWGKESHNILHNDNYEILIPTSNCLSIFNLSDGVTMFEYNKAFRGNIIMDSENIYLSDGQSLMCYNIKKKTEKWHTDANVLIYGSYKSKIIAQTLDEKVYDVVNKIDGKIENQIANPYIKNINLLFMENYVLIDSENLYK